MASKTGRKTTSVSLAVRTTPRCKGGLGQIDIRKQVTALHYKWALTHLANPVHPWAAYWEYQIELIQKHFRTRTHPTVLQANWSKLRPTRKNRLSPIVVAAYKAWHQTEHTIDYTDRTAIAKQPLLDNKYILVNGSPITATNPERNLIDHLQAMHLGFFYTPRPAPNKHKFRKKTKYFLSHSLELE